MENPQDELNYIKQMMQVSQTFRGMSGWAAVWMGLVAGTAGVVALHPMISTVYYRKLSILGVATFFLAFFGGLYIINRKAKKDGVELWTPAFVRIMRNMLTVVLLGGMASVAMIMQQQTELAISNTLLAYGFGLFMLDQNSSKGVSILGLMYALLGVISCFLPHYSLYLWLVGFCGLHLVYGAWLLIKK